MIGPRFDRLPTVYFFHPLLNFLKRIRLHQGLRIPILMYHNISSKEDEKVHPYYKTNTSPDVFQKHMKFLYDNHYDVINMSEAVKYLFQGKNTEDKFIVITFDDGYRDFCTHAFPILKNYEFTATVFLPTAFISNNRLKFKTQKCLTWNEVRELNREGIIFGSHTVTHPNLRLLTKDDIQYEIEHSKQTIEDKIGASVESFSYPFAFAEKDKEFKEYLRIVLERCAYKNGVTTRIGTTTKDDNIFFLKRIPVNSFDDLCLFRAKLDGGYDWLRMFQVFVKLIKPSGKIAAQPCEYLS